MKRMLAAVLACLMLAGCGEAAKPADSGNGGGETETAVEKAQSAIEDGDYRKAYDLLKEDDSAEATELLGKFGFVLSVEVDDDGTHAYTYDERGNRLSATHTDWYDQKSEAFFTYDENNNLLTERLIGADGQNNGEYTYTYDTEGRLVKEVQCLFGHTTTIDYTYNAEGKLLTERWDSGEGSWYVWEYTYPDSNTEKKVYSSDTTTNYEEITTVYDAGGNILRVNALQEGEFYYEQEFTYDERGNVLTSYDSFGDIRVTNTYDADGKLIAAKSTGEYYDDKWEATYTYDDKGNLVEEVRGRTTTVYTYDADGNMVTKTEGFSEYTYTWQLVYYPNGAPQK